MRSSSGINAGDYKNQLNVFKMCWNSPDLVNFPIFITLEYYILVFYCVYIFVIKTMLYCFLLQMFVELILLKYIKGGPKLGIQYIVYSIVLMVLLRY